MRQPVTSRTEIANLRQVFKAAIARGAEILKKCRDDLSEDMDAPIDSEDRKRLLENFITHYQFPLHASRQPPDALLGRLFRGKKRGTYTVLSLAKISAWQINLLIPSILI